MEGGESFHIPASGGLRSFEPGKNRIMAAGPHFGGGSLYCFLKDARMGGLASMPIGPCAKGRSKACLCMCRAVGNGCGARVMGSKRGWATDVPSYCLIDEGILLANGRAVFLQKEDGRSRLMLKSDLVDAAAAGSAGERITD